MQFITTGNRIMIENFTVGLFYTITFTNGNYLACTCNGIGDNFVSFLCTEPTMQFILDLSTAETVDTIELYGGGAGTMNYNELENKPSINGETLVGNLSTTDLHIRAVPPIDTTDNNKVLTASYADGVTTYSWQTVPTGTTNYNDLTNKPEINGHVLSGNQLSSQLGLATAAQGALADTAVQPADLASYQPLIDSGHKLSPALIATDTTNQFATQSQLDQIETNKNNILNIISYINSTKNLFTNTAVSGSDSTLSWVVNSDKTVTLTGTAPTNNFRIELGTFTFESGKKYILSGCPENGSSTTYRLYGANASDTRVYDFGDGSSVITGDGTEYTFYIYVNDANTSMTGKIYKPMICTETAWNVSHDYAPKV